MEEGGGRRDEEDEGETERLEEGKGGSGSNKKMHPNYQNEHAKNAVRMKDTSQKRHRTS